jgi:hypothetical protein
MSFFSMSLSYTHLIRLRCGPLLCLHCLSIFFKGYFTFNECPGMINPTIGVEVGETYIFVQEDRSNWYHPMGFAYFPDGEHDSKDELEPVITQTGSDCVTTSTCPSPRYFRNGEFLGNPDDPADFGLDVYEPEFRRGIVEWTKLGVYTVELNFDDYGYVKDIFYFCHVRILRLHIHYAGIGFTFLY